MSEVRVEIVPGVWLPLAQADAMERIAEIELGGHYHWHRNECGCCIAVHGRDCAYVIGPDGGSTFYAVRGCDCEPDA
jgi:hypothetical protein